MLRIGLAFMQAAVSLNISHNLLYLTTDGMAYLTLGSTATRTLSTTKHNRSVSLCFSANGLNKLAGGVDIFVVSIVHVWQAGRGFVSSTFFDDECMLPDSPALDGQQSSQ